MSWLELSLNLNGELAEAVTEVLSRYASGGVAIEMPANSNGDLSAATDVLVKAYIPIDGQEDEQRRRIEESLWHLSQIQPLPEPDFRIIKEADWQTSWKKHFQPIAIGKRLLIIPPWITTKEIEREVIVLEPGMAFGTGLHPSTRICLEAMEDILQPGDNILDIGCGTGILSIAAILLGANHVLAVDTDEIAVQATRENAERNRVAEYIRVESGSLEQVKILQLETQKTDLIVANILTHILMDLIQSGLATCVKPKGRIILSGILVEQVEPLVNLAADANLELIDVRSEKDWRGLIFKRELPR
ncbi:MAG: 50S ribosomal protein L11 methyltransferase [Anaerolineales bacterium]|nr:50S ribosomal protein L11 methyltransferase [Anaerolineales bacterium]